jgi:hypothetical protein
MEPFNYSLNFTPAVQAAMASYQGGLKRQADAASQALQDQQTQLGMDATRQTMGLQATQADQQATLFAQGQQDRAAQQQAEAQAQQRNAEAQQAMAALAQNPNATMQDYMTVIATYPEIRDAVKSQWDMMDTANQQTATKQAAELFAAAKSGNKDAVLRILQDQVDAAKNSGNPQAVMEAQHLMDVAGMDGGMNSLATTFGLQFAATQPEKFAEIMKAVTPEPLSPEGKLAADKAAGLNVNLGPEWRTATPEELAQHPGAVAGQVNTKSGHVPRHQVNAGIAARFGVQHHFSAISQGDHVLARNRGR